MLKRIGTFLILLLVSNAGYAQFLSTDLTLDFNANTSFTGGNLFGNAVITIKSGATVTFTGGVGVNNFATIIVEPGAKLIITTGGLNLSNDATVTVNGAISVRGGGMNVNNNADISFNGVNRDTIVGNVQFTNNVVTVVGPGTDLFINGNLTGNNNAGFDVDGTISINGNANTTNNVTFTGDGDVLSTGNMTGGNNSNMFGLQPFDCPSGPCSGRDFCTAYSNTISSATTVGACSGASFTITGNTPSGSPAYLWQSTTTLGGAWSTASGTSTSRDYTASGLAATTYYRRRVIVSGCTTFTRVVTVYATPPPAPTTSTASFCGSASVTLSAFNSPGTYQWYSGSSGANAISGATNPNYTTPTISSSTTYFVTSIIGNCESTTRTPAVAAPIGPPTVTGTTRCGANNVTLLAFGSPTGVQRWYTAPSGGSPIHTTPIYTTYLATTTTFYVSSVLGACESARTPVTANILTSLSAPTVTSNSPICSGQTLQLTGPSGGTQVTYSWSGPSSFSSTLQSPSRTNATTAMAGTYTLTLSAPGCTSANGTTTVTVNTAPTVPTGVTGTTTICSGSSTTITATGGTGTGYRWYSAPTSGTLLASTAAFTTPTLTSNTTYHVARTNGSCESATRLAVTVTVNPIPSAPTAGSNSPVCAGSAINLTASTISGATYSWTGPNSFTSTTQNPIITSATAAMAGTYSVTATVSGCVSSAGTVLVTVVSGGGTTTTISSPGSSTYTVPAGVYSITIQAWGGGGGGSKGYSNTKGTGGGGGGFVQKTVSVNPGDIVSLVVGAGGAEQTISGNGNAGGTSSATVGSTSIFATGGFGGRSTAIPTDTGGLGGIGFGGDYMYRGGSGTLVNFPMAASPGGSGGGGAGSLGNGFNSDGSLTTNYGSNSTGGPGGAGGGGAGGDGGVCPSSCNGQIGAAPGGGGGGNAGTGNGAKGGDGRITIIAYTGKIEYPSSLYCTSTGSPVTPTTFGLSGGSYTSTPSGLSISSTTGAITPSLSSAGDYTISYVNACGVTIATTFITIGTPRTTGATIIGTQTICSGSVATYAVAPIGGGSSTIFNWTVPSGATILSGANTNAISVVFGNSGGNVTVTPSNTCGVGATLSMSVNGGVTFTNPSTASANYCVGGTVNPLTVTGGTTYQWFSNSTNSNSGGTPVGTNSSSFTPSNTTSSVLYYYAVISAGNGCSVTSNVSGLITVNPRPTTPIATSNSPVCTGTSINLSTPAVSGVTYAWTGPGAFSSALRNPTRPSATTAMEELQLLL